MLIHGRMEFSERTGLRSHQCLRAHDGGKGEPSLPVWIEHRSSGSEIWISVKLGAAEGAALVPVADAIGGQRLLCGQGCSGVFFGAAGRPVAVAERWLVVPPGPFVVGRAEEDLEANVGMLEADADELHEILGLEPDRQPPVIERGIAERLANAVA